MNKSNGWGGARPNTGGKQVGAGRLQQWLHLDMEHARTLRLLVMRRVGAVPHATPESIVSEMIDAAWQEADDGYQENAAAIEE